ncbi:MAG: arsenate reductase (glutaredoxin) [Rhodothermales bacterium]
MSKDVIYHNPRCSKSRATLDILRRENVHVDVIDYLKTPPTAEELADICTRLDIEPAALIRTKESLFKELGLSLDDPRSREAWCALLAEHPRLIERPIVIVNGKAVIGRPPENVYTIIR